MLVSLDEQTTSSIVLIAFLAILHGSFQLATSVLTLISGHSLMHRQATRRVLTLNLAYIIGVISMTWLILLALTSLMLLWLPTQAIVPLWLGLIATALVVAVAVMTLYYRKGKGTRLWIPRDFADYLTNRAHTTKNSVESAGLGMVSVVAELPFTGVLLAITSLLLATKLEIDELTPIMLVYCLVATLPLICITALIAGGHRLSVIQRWRESNKFFLQYAAGAGLFAAALYALVYFVLLEARL